MYLETIVDTEYFPLRVLGMLTEYHALIGDIPKYEQYAARAAKYKQENPYERFDSLDDALARARAHVERRSTHARAYSSKLRSWTLQSHCWRLWQAGVAPRPCHAAASGAVASPQPHLPECVQRNGHGG